MRKFIIAYASRNGTLVESDYLEDRKGDVRVILKWILRDWVERDAKQT
jgi:hypothetical protein